MLESDLPLKEPAFQEGEDAGVKVGCYQEGDPARDSDPDRKPKYVLPGLFIAEEGGRCERIGDPDEEHQQHLGGKGDQDRHVGHLQAVDLVDHIDYLGDEGIDKNGRRSKKDRKIEIEDDDAGGDQLGRAQIDDVETAEGGKGVLAISVYDRDGENRH